MSGNNLYEEVIIAGFGGQGIILAGKLLAQAGMKASLEVTYMPSYGAEMRGGTANSMITISNKPVASPLVTNPNSAIVMNKASVEKFAARVKKNGLIVYNSSLINAAPAVDSSIKLLAMPADDLAVELGNIKIANMVILGAYLQTKNIISCDTAAESLSAVLAKRYHKTIPLNTAALQKGAEFAKKAEAENL
ncbi:MAG: 2-oxoacid:acceptor oxidoreductase family protein [Phycisphaerae bacterium]